ncbi:uncharacterized protein LOC119427737 [Nematolebias whitei]|uniref:uncharacterized protein LOC119427737 n=1 Tax=Nematolebias whitei TaxID=451745 RepID=UPI00189A3352|nr:uncharacterized protein LOC119427737 [Nematolebias whitei]
MGFGKTLAITGSAAVGGVGAVIAAPVVLGAVGFTSAGITAGSYAAGMMSAAASANGGGVAAGSLVALLQSAGAAGLSATANAAVASIGGSIGAGIGWLASILQDEEGKKRKEEEEEEKKKIFWVTVLPALIILYNGLNGHGLSLTSIAAVACVGSGAGWLAKLFQNKRQKRKKEEEEEEEEMGKYVLGTEWPPSTKSFRAGTQLYSAALVYQDVWLLATL